ncbi:MAG: exosortase/archaeosortase family protein [Gammaproteobacteria bacterium]|nr:exosortase/archaeosortase family protein [Gammaproteobacteria bacterium]
MVSPKLFVAGQLLVFWPVWGWYVRRMLDGSDEPWGVLALVTVLLLLCKRGRWAVPSRVAIISSCLVMIVYTVGYDRLPDLIRAILAVLALAFILGSMCYQRMLHASLAGLLLVSLPLIASLQFYGGYPIRLLTAFISAQLLNLFGLEVIPRGTLLYWMGEVIAVDAPCAGIKMLWTGLYLNFTLALWRNLTLLTTWVCTSMTMMAVFVGNVVRATVLFFTESGIVEAPPIAHQAIGLLVFSLIVIWILTIHRYQPGAKPCVTG